MAGDYQPLNDRKLAVRVVERSQRSRQIPGTRAQLQRLTEAEIEYLRWLGRKVLAERNSGDAT